MIYVEWFENDPMWIRDIQGKVYWEYIAYPYHLAKEKYLEAERILGIETEIGAKCKVIEGGDHRFLQHFHDAIAAKFRYNIKNDFVMQSDITLEGSSLMRLLSRNG